MNLTSARHRQEAADLTARFSVLTISDTRTLQTDPGGAAIITMMKETGHELVSRGLVPDEPARIEVELRSLLDDPNVDLVITTGGTGIAPRDTTIEVVDRLLNRRLEGFGELFRMLSYQEIGAAAMLSRATGGLAGNRLLFALPGSPHAVELALSKLILLELPHLLLERGGRMG